MGKLSYTTEQIDTLLGLTSYAAGDEVLQNLMSDIEAAEKAAQAAAEAAAEAAAAAARAVSALGLTVVDGKLCVTYNT